MELLIVSFIAGVLTILAPCILPLLPVIIGGSATGAKSLRAPLIITISLALSVVIFTLLLKASTALLGVPTLVWQIISGVLILVFGLQMAWPSWWEKLAVKLNLSSNRLLGKASQQKGISREILMGAALGPVFSSCSPTYALIVASVLPASFGQGLTYLVAYAVGLSVMLLLVALLGQQFVSKLGWASNPHGWFKRTIGLLFIIVGLGIIFGLDKQLQALILESGLYNPISDLEHTFMR